MSINPVPLLILMMALGPLLANAQSNEADKASRRAGFEVAGPLQSALADTAKELKTPIGLVEDSLDNGPCQIRPVLVRPNGLEDALESIVNQCSRYTWRKGDKDAFVEPKRAIKSPLDLSIDAFTIDNATTAQAQRIIMNLPEVKNWLDTNGIRVFDLESPTSRRTSDDRLSMSLRGVKLYEVLDAISRSTGKMFWRVVWFDNDMFMGIYF